MAVIRAFTIRGLDSGRVTVETTAEGDQIVLSVCSGPHEPINAWGADKP